MKKLSLADPHLLECLLGSESDAALYRKVSTVSGLRIGV